MSVRLGGSIDFYSVDVQRIDVVQVHPADVVRVLDTVEKRAALLRVQKVPLPSVGPQQLELHAHEGDYLLMLSEVTEGGDWNVRTLSSTELPPGFVLVLGDSWHSSMISRDIEIVKRAFVEFVVTGNVSTDLLR
jgi:hypothetical protein